MISLLTFSRLKEITMGPNPSSVPRNVWCSKKMERERKRDRETERQRQRGERERKKEK